MSPANSSDFQKMLGKLRDNFLEEVPEKLGRLDQVLITMEKAGVTAEAFDEFYRIIHSLKGSGGTFGLHIITTICHQLEDLLNTTQGGQKYEPALIGISFSYIDLLRLAVEQIQAQQDSFPQIEKRLSELRAQITQKEFTVLIVNNSKLLTQIYQQVLAEFSVQTVVMGDGYIALMRALTEPFDLIITDHELPVLSGLALIGALRLSESKNRDIQTILVTLNPNIKKNRHTDANYVILKNQHLAENLAEATEQALSSIKS